MRLGRLRRCAVAAAATIAAGTTIMLGTTTSAHAAAGCYNRGPTRTDTTKGLTFST